MPRRVREHVAGVGLPVRETRHRSTGPVRRPRCASRRRCSRRIGSVEDIGSPPVAPGVNDTVADPFAVTATTLVGVDGGADRPDRVRRAEAGPCPIALMPATTQVYVLPFVSPVNSGTCRREHHLRVHRRRSRCTVTRYRMTGLPPSMPGVNVRVACTIAGRRHDVRRRVRHFEDRVDRHGRDRRFAVTVLSFTTSWKFNACGPIAWVTVGAVNVGFCAVAELERHRRAPDLGPRVAERGRCDGVEEPLPSS